MEAHIQSQLAVAGLKNYLVESLVINSDVLKGNPLGDPTERVIPVLMPKNQADNMPVVFLLAGFAGNSPFYFNGKFNEENAVQEIDRLTSEKRAPLALYVFVDALTSWGGSQFLNSKAVGRYEDYIMQEIVPSIRHHYQVSKRADRWCVMGGSSGGYGAIQLSSKYPDIFGVVAAIAPDCLFEVSLMNDLYLALPYLETKKSFKAIFQDLKSGKLKKIKNSFQVLNAVGMSACYSPTGKGLEAEFPLSKKDGTLIPTVMRKWKQHDPLVFLKKREKNVKRLKGFFLTAGKFDQFHLQYGARQMHQLLKAMKVRHQYEEFDGTHFDLSSRRCHVFVWLNERWLS